MRQKLSTMFLALSLVALSACNGGGGGGGGGTIDPYHVNNFINLLENTYGGDMTLMKRPTETMTEGFAVVWDQDMGAYYAYDLANYQVGDNWDSYLANVEYEPVVIHDWYVDSWGETIYAGDAYDWTGTYAGEFLFEEQTATPKDLETLSAIEEAYNVEKISEALSAEYGLSAERGQKIAKMAASWKKLSNSRSMTDSDVSAFTKELVGVSLEEANGVLKKYAEGDSQSMDNFLNSAAQVNGTTPEQMKNIIETFMSEN